METASGTFFPNPPMKEGQDQVPETEPRLASQKVCQRDNFFFPLMILLQVHLQ